MELVHGEFFFSIGNEIVVLFSTIGCVMNLLHFL